MKTLSLLDALCRSDCPEYLLDDDTRGLLSTFDTNVIEFVSKVEYRKVCNEMGIVDAAQFLVKMHGRFHNDFISYRWFPKDYSIVRKTFSREKFSYKILYNKWRKSSVGFRKKHFRESFKLIKNNPDTPFEILEALI